MCTEIRAIDLSRQHKPQETNSSIQEARTYLAKALPDVALVVGVPQRALPRPDPSAQKGARASKHEWGDREGAEERKRGNGVNARLRRLKVARRAEQPTGAPRPVRPRRLASVSQTARVCCTEAPRIPRYKWGRDQC